MNGVAPTYETIADFAYPGARPLFIYVKKRASQRDPGPQRVRRRICARLGRRRLLSPSGLIASPDDGARANAEIAQADAHERRDLKQR